jgi:hypothetical protein
VPSAYPFEHVPGQEIPEPDTVPEPEPVSETVRVCVGIVVNVAVTLWSELIITLHVVVPAHAPPQPANVEPDAGVAVRDSIEPAR